MHNKTSLPSRRRISFLGDDPRKKKKSSKVFRRPQRTVMVVLLLHLLNFSETFFGGLPAVGAVKEEVVSQQAGISDEAQQFIKNQKQQQDAIEYELRGYGAKFYDKFEHYIGVLCCVGVLSLGSYELFLFSWLLSSAKSGVVVTDTDEERTTQQETTRFYVLRVI